MRTRWPSALALTVLLGGCASIPAGPSVMVLPGTGRTFEQFQVDDGACRQWALGQAGVAPSEAAQQQGMSAAVIGTAVGAGVGAALGAAAGDAGVGAAIGAGTGLLFGAAAGTNAAYATGWEMQRRYDIGYQQCMYAKGHQIPGRVSARAPARAAPLAPPPPPSSSHSPPPPPPGPPPPPPPGVPR
jgi:hypothetical protein